VKFNTIQFLVFFPVIATLFFFLPHRWRWVLLLAGSYLFYISWNPKYIIVLLAVTAVGYIAGLWLTTATDPKARRLRLSLSLATVLGILFFFKYFDQVNHLLQAALGPRFGSDGLPGIHVVLPLGISFFSLQAISYIIDIYRGVYRPEKHAGIFALFIAFFPHLTAGPISRANHLLPQFHESHSADYEKIVTGLQRMAWGFFKKLVIADRLALFVNPIYDQPSSYAGAVLILATYAFAMQIYCDFSGYADIAIGMARIMGFQLQENFQQPYYAQSIVDFWRRWHISLYNWLRDYIFYPMSRALRRSGIHSSNMLALILPPMATMLVSGVWHGTNWTFLVWGALHGMFMVFSVLLDRWKNQLHLPFTLPQHISAGLRIFATFNLVSFAWIFFRANTVSDAMYIVGHLFVKPEIPSSLFEIMPGGWYEWMIALLALLVMEAVHWMQERNDGLATVIRRQPTWLRWSAYYGLVMVIFMFGKFGANEFIYSRF
jgi:D-alanyl-lipoteichoic acid acyltransferase DltB (MBOAT superfamily)